jgi:hypothetical protein
MAKQPPFMMAGTLPDDHNLAAIRKALQEDPREQHLAIVKLRNMRTSVDHPLDGPDVRNPIIILDEMWVVIDGADRDQAEAMMLRARLESNPEPTFDDAAAEDEARARLASVPDPKFQDGDQ